MPAHFPQDAHGLYEFDGEPLYEYQGRDRREHHGWGTRCFDVGREEVQSFLISNATFWIEQYHADGLRVDAVASMLYLDYDRKPDEWVPNVHGDNRNLEAMAFFRKLNAHVRGAHPDVLMIAEESTAWGNLTSTEGEGLGFSLKWNMGWMNDTLAFAECDPLFRRHEHNRLTFSLTYAFGEKYVLPISHDEVVHGKKSFLDRMPGPYEQKFAGARLFLAYMMTHPGKKLLFMGSEYGPFREWDFENELEWFMLDYDMHAKFQLFVSELNAFYLENPELWEQDGSWAGFEWIDADRRDDNTLLYRRIAKNGSILSIVLNFAPVVRYYNIPLKRDGMYAEVFNSVEEKYGGGGVTNKVPQMAFKQYGGYGINITVPPLGFTVIKGIEGNDEA